MDVNEWIKTYSYLLPGLLLLAMFYAQTKGEHEAREKARREGTLPEYEEKQKKARNWKIFGYCAMTFWAFALFMGMWEKWERSLPPLPVDVIAHEPVPGYAYLNKQNYREKSGYDLFRLRASDDLRYIVYQANLFEEEPRPQTKSLTAVLDVETQSTIASTIETGLAPMLRNTRHLFRHINVQHVSFVNDSPVLYLQRVERSLDPYWESLLWGFANAWYKRAGFEKSLCFPAERMVRVDHGANRRYSVFRDGFDRFIAHQGSNYEITENRFDTSGIAQTVDWSWRRHADKAETDHTTSDSFSLINTNFVHEGFYVMRYGDRHIFFANVEGKPVSRSFSDDELQAFFPEAPEPPAPVETPKPKIADVPEGSNPMRELIFGATPTEELIRAERYQIKGKRMGWSASPRDPQIDASEPIPLISLSPKGADPFIAYFHVPGFPIYEVHPEKLQDGELGEIFVFIGAAGYRKPFAAVNEGRTILAMREESPFHEVEVRFNKAAWHFSSSIRFEMQAIAHRGEDGLMQEWRVEELEPSALTEIPYEGPTRVYDRPLKGGRFLVYYHDIFWTVCWDGSGLEPLFPREDGEFLLSAMESAGSLN